MILILFSSCLFERLLLEVTEGLASMNTFMEQLWMSIFKGVKKIVQYFFFFGQDRGSTTANTVSPIYLTASKSI
jgi:hypothetical protein